MITYSHFSKLDSVSLRLYYQFRDIWYTILIMNSPKPFWLNLALQRLQVCGRMPLCCHVWICSELFCVNALLQMVHCTRKSICLKLFFKILVSKSFFHKTFTLKGFSPVCTLICRISWLGFWKVFKHMVHLYIVLCFVPS